MRDLFHLVWPLVQPSNALVLLLVMGGLLIVFGRRRPGRLMVGAGITFGTAIMVLPLQSIMMVALETRFPSPTLPDKVDGIITLGGAIHPVNSEQWAKPQVSERSERLTETVKLARQYPQARLVATGGSWNKAEASEAEHAAAYIQEMGVPQSGVMIETFAGNTYENAKLSQQLVNPSAAENWILVTSASHMPRAVGVFRKLGWDVIPYPVDYETEGRIELLSLQSVSNKLTTMDFATRAWCALIAYRLMGLTDSLFPGPSEYSAAGSQ